MDPTIRHTAATLRAREAKSRQERAARQDGARQAVDQIVRLLVKPPARAWLIGSLAWGGFGAESDVDLVLSGLDSSAMLALEKQVARAAVAPVDLLTLEDLPTSFRERIIDSGIKLV